MGAALRGQGDGFRRGGGQGSRGRGGPGPHPSSATAWHPSAAHRPCAALVTCTCCTRVPVTSTPPSPQTLPFRDVQGQVLFLPGPQPPSRLHCRQASPAEPRRKHQRGPRLSRSRYSSSLTLGSTRPPPPPQEEGGSWLGTQSPPATGGTRPASTETKAPWSPRSPKDPDVHWDSGLSPSWTTTLRRQHLNAGLG